MLKPLRTFLAVSCVRWYGEQKHTSKGFVVARYLPVSRAWSSPSWVNLMSASRIEVNLSMSGWEGGSKQKEEKQTTNKKEH